MKTIVCYGDSNTHGYDPRNSGRYDYSVRWPGQLQRLLGREDYYVVEEGLNSRTIVQSDRCYDDNKSGVDLVSTVIKTHMTVDLLIMMLGTNDMKLRFHMTPVDIARAIALLVLTAKQVSASKDPDGKPCPILLVAPPLITENLRNGRCYEEFGDRAILMSKELAARYEQVAKTHQVYFLDAAKIVTPSELDGLHLGVEGHEILAQHIAEQCHHIFNDI